MIITLNHLLQGLPTKREDKNYLSTEAYVEPFVDEMKAKGANFTVKVEMAKQVVRFAGQVIPVFNRVWIQATLPEAVCGYRTTYHMAYALNVNQPGYSFFKGWADGFGRLVIPGKDYVITKVLLSEKEIPQDYRDLFDKEFDIARWEARMKGTFITDSPLFLGTILDRAITTSIVHCGNAITKLGVKEVVSPYASYFSPREHTVSYYDYYTAIVSHIQENEIYNVASKLVLANSLFLEDRKA